MKAGTVVSRGEVKTLSLPTTFKGWAITIVAVAAMFAATVGMVWSTTPRDTVAVSDVIDHWYGRPPMVTPGGFESDSYIAARVGQSGTIAVGIKGYNPHEPYKWIRGTVQSTLNVPNKQVWDDEKKTYLSMYHTTLDAQATREMKKYVKRGIDAIVIDGKKVFQLQEINLKVAQPLVTPRPYDRKRDGPKPREQMMMAIRKQASGGMLVD